MKPISMTRPPLRDLKSLIGIPVLIVIIVGFCHYVFYPYLCENHSEWFKTVADILPRIYGLLAFVPLYIVVTLVNWYKRQKYIFLFKDIVLIEHLVYRREFRISEIVSYDVLSGHEGLIINFGNSKLSIESDFENYAVFMKELNELTGFFSAFEFFKDRWFIDRNEEYIELSSFADLKLGYDHLLYRRWFKSNRLDYDKILDWSLSRRLTHSLRLTTRARSLKFLFVHNVEQMEFIEQVLKQRLEK